MALTDYLLISTFVPATLVPALFATAFFRLWSRLKHWPLRVLAWACVLVVVAQISQHFAVNIPRFGKTEAQVALAKDIPWLSTTALVSFSVAAWALFIGVVGLLFATKHFYMDKTES